MPVQTPRFSTTETDQDNQPSCSATKDDLLEFSSIEKELTIEKSDLIMQLGKAQRNATFYKGMNTVLKYTITLMVSIILYLAN